MSRKWTKSRTRGRKLHLTEAKARVGRPRKTRADLERQLKACKREIANARERLIEATKQQTATSEMLRIILDSPLQSVLDAVAEHAARLCDNTAEIYRLENNLIRLVASYGELPVHIQAREGFPVNRDRVIGRTICDQRSVHVHDLAAEDSEYPLGSSDAKRLGHRTTLGIPLLRERTLIGGILFRRWEVRPFSDNQIALLESFADQAAIAIENVRLFEAEKQRTLALAQANRDLAEREAKIRCLVEANIIGIFVSDIEGQIIEANDAFLHLLGYDREDLAAGRVNRTYLTPPEWRERDARTVAEVKATGTVQPFEKEYFHKDGGRTPVLIGVTAFDEKRDQVIGFVLDLTERKRAEAELRESEQNYRMLFESIDEGFCTIEVLFNQNEKPVDYRFLKVSPSFERQTGIKNAAGRRMREIAPLHEEHWFEIYGKIALTGQSLRFENEAKQRGRWYDVYAFRVEDPKHRRVGILFSDITERKRAEAEARDSERRYREVEAGLAHASRLATMGELTASIAHEMKQPITSSILNAKAALSWLDRPTPELDEVRQALGGVINNGKRASDVIERIRDLVKKAPPRKDLLEINGAIREVIELTHGETVKDGVAVEMHLSEELPLIEGDRVQLQQVVLNLIINAIQAMSATSDGSRQLLITTVKEDSGDVLVAVQDSGPGLTSGAIQQIFQPFLTTKPGGLGLGLSICRSIIEAHGGRLWASPNEPRGAIFQFTLPAQSNGA